MIQFDVYPRELKVDGPDGGTQVIESNREFTVDAAINTFLTDGEFLELCAIPTRVVIHTPDCSMVTQPKERSLTLTKDIPEPLRTTNAPGDLNPDESFGYTPTVEGGYGPYTFILVGDLPAGFTFDSSTGELKRPPQ